MATAAANKVYNEPWLLRSYRKHEKGGCDKTGKLQLREKAKGSNYSNSKLFPFPIAGTTYCMNEPSNDFHPNIRDNLAHTE